jgi:hypothetical protein
MVLLLIALGLIVVPLYVPEIFEWLPNGEFLCYAWVVFAFLMGLAILLVTKPWRPLPGADPRRRIPRGPETGGTSSTRRDGYSSAGSGTLVSSRSW